MGERENGVFIIYPDMRTNISFIFQKIDRVIDLYKRVASEQAVLNTIDKLDMSLSLGSLPAGPQPGVLQGSRDCCGKAGQGWKAWYHGLTVPETPQVPEVSSSSRRMSDGAVSFPLRVNGQALNEKQVYLTPI